MRYGRTHIGPAAWLIPLLIALLALALPAAGEAAGTGSISGTVTGEGSGPLGGVDVCAEPIEGFEEEFELPCDRSGPNGAYDITGLADGEYVVYFFPSFGVNYVGRPYAEAGDDFTPVQVVGGGTTSGIDAELERGATISGTVTAAATGAPVPMVFVCAIPLEEGEFECAETNGLGRYAILGLSGGRYTLEFSTEETGQNLLSTELGPVTVSAGGELTGIDVALQAGGVISGTVRAAATGAPLGGVEVCITEANFAWPDGCLVTPSSGRYSFIGVWNATFKVVFSPVASEFVERGAGRKFTPATWPTQWWNGQSTFAAATPIQGIPGATVAGIDGSLGPGPVVTPPVTPPAPPATKVLTPQPKKLKCHRGFVKKKLKGKARCVKRHKVKRHRGKHHAKPRAHAAQSR